MELICLGSVPKQIADDLEISISTVNSHIAEMCRKAKVSRSELLIYTLQYPDALKRDGVSEPGLHSVGCGCESPFCWGMRKRA